MKIKKIYILLFVFCIMFFAFCNNSFAVEYEYEFDFSAITEPYKWIIITNGDRTEFEEMYTVFVIASDNEDILKLDTSDFMYKGKETIAYVDVPAFCFKPQDYTYKVYKYTGNRNDNIVTVKRLSKSYEIKPTSSTKVVNYADRVVISSERDIFLEDGTIFFHANSQLPSIEYTDIKIHLKDLDCAVWRNFILKFPEFEDYRYAIFLDHYERVEGSCNKNVKAKFKLYVLNEIGSEIHFARPLIEDSIIEDSGGYHLYYGQNSKKIFIPYSTGFYKLYETELVFNKESVEFFEENCTFNYIGDYSVELADEMYRIDDYAYELFGNCIGDNSNFIGSNVNIYSVYKKQFLLNLLEKLSNNISIFNVFRAFTELEGSIKVHDYLDLYKNNISLSGYPDKFGEEFSHDFFTTYSNSHVHVENIDENGNVSVSQDENINETGSLDSSKNYIQLNDSNSILSVDESILDYVSIPQKPTNTETYLVENENGEVVENTGSIAETDTDIIEGNDDTSNWEILDFLKGLFDFLGNIVKKIGSLVFDLLQGILNLFIPDISFWNSFADDMNVDLNEHLGLLFQPFEILGGLLERYNNIDFGEPKLIIPEIKVPLTDYVLLNQMEFNFNDILEYDVFNYIHEIYLIAVDAYLIFILFNRILEIEREVFEK